MKKMTQNQMQLIILLLMVVVITAAYRFGFQAFDSKAKSIMVENNKLELRLSELEQKMTQKDTYETGIKDAEGQLTAIYGKYGAGNTPQKSIMMICEMEAQAQMSVNNITFAPDSSIYSSTKLREDGTSVISLDTTQLTINFDSGYEELKECMKFINNYPERMNVESLNAVLNQETGLLSGAMIINLYSLVRENSTYKEPVISDIKIGTDNIFGTYTLPAADGQ